MLLELVVENYAVVDRLRVRFHAGLNLLTGETGSGKSMVVDALGLLLGGRASADMIRSGETRARIAGIFEVRDHAGSRKLLEPAGLAVEDGELLIEREILAGGKSRAFIGQPPRGGVAAEGAGAAARRYPRPARSAAPVLARSPARHAGCLRRKSRAWTGSGVYSAGPQPARSWRSWKESEQEKLRLLDLWQFQRKEIESAALEAGEDAALENGAAHAAKPGRLQENAGAAYEALYDSPESALARARSPPSASTSCAASIRPSPPCARI